MVLSPAPWSHTRPSIRPAEIRTRRASPGTFAWCIVRDKKRSGAGERLLNHHHRELGLLVHWRRIGITNEGRGGGCVPPSSSELNVSTLDALLAGCRNVKPQVRLTSNAGRSAKRHKASQFFPSSQSGHGFSLGLSRPLPPVRKNSHSACWSCEQDQVWFRLEVAGGVGIKKWHIPIFGFRRSMPNEV